MVEKLLETLDLRISQANVVLEAFFKNSIGEDLKVDDLSNNFHDGLSCWLNCFKVIKTSVIDICKPGIFAD